MTRKPKPSGTTTTADGFIEWMTIAALKRADRNPKQHDQAGIIASLKRFGFVDPCIINERTGKLVAGHGRTDACAEMKSAGDDPPARVRVDAATGHWLLPVLRGISFKNASEAEAYLIASNRLPESGGWDKLGMGAILADFKLHDVSVEGLGFSDREVERLIALGTTAIEPVEPAAIARPLVSRVKVGEVWQLGRHVLVCGDCRDPEIWKRAGVEPESAELVHGDPPYGMNKGFENDQLQASALDRFQMEWWATVHRLLKPTASAFVWGNAADLWRWWYTLLQAWSTETKNVLTFCNEVVWDKEFATGQGTATVRSFPVVTERALFFQLGRQGFGNKNKDRYWDGWEPLRLYLKGEFEAAGLTSAKVKKLLGNNMFNHWVSTSQWVMIPADHYETLHQHTEGKQFAKAYGVIKQQHETLLAQYNDWLEGDRAFFDATHDPNLSDVWRFGRVDTDERFGHDTPKPVLMMVRTIRSSCGADGLVLSPFGGTGTDLLAAEQSGRRCAMAELDPLWCEVIIQRFEALTKTTAVRR